MTSCSLWIHIFSTAMLIATTASSRPAEDTDCLVTQLFKTASVHSAELKELKRDVKTVEDQLLNNVGSQDSRVDDVAGQIEQVKANITELRRDINSVEGIKGERGDRGSVGLAGANGTKGERGEVGIKGANGTKGERGVQGDPGIQGIRGEMGPAGPQQLLSSIIDCNDTMEGYVRYSKESKSVLFCDGTDWIGLAPIESALGESRRNPGNSCKDILSRSVGNVSTGVYWIQPSSSYPPFQTYCDMDGGWSLIMKMDGTQLTFEYYSALWSNNVTLNTDSLDLSATESKMATYFTLNITELRLGMTDGGTTRWRDVSLGTAVPSLYSMIADGNYRPTNFGRDAWISLIDNAGLQANCNREGFNVMAIRLLRIGIITNDQNDCLTPDSFLGFGTYISGISFTVGSQSKGTFGYILGR